MEDSDGCVGLAKRQFSCQVLHTVSQLEVALMKALLLSLIDLRVEVWR